MSTGIEWCDETWNPVTGCSKVSQGCKHCYAETMAKRTWGAIYQRMSAFDSAGQETGTRPREFTDVWTHEERLTLPLKWRRPRRIFVNSMSDLWHPAVPDAFIDRVFAVMALADWHTFIVLTKRPERMRDYCTSRFWLDRVIQAGEQMKASRPPAHWYHVSDWSCRTSLWPLPHVQLGVSVEDQPTADERIPLLIQTPAATRIVSYEPALATVSFKPWLDRLDQIIVGGESGSKARPFYVGWARSVVAQCKAAGVACFVKQLGAYIVDRNDLLGTDKQPDDPRDWPEPNCGWDDTSRGNVVRGLDGTRDGYQGAPVRIITRDRKGGDPSEWPEDLRVRELV